MRYEKKMPNRFLKKINGGKEMCRHGNREKTREKEVEKYNLGFNSF